MTRHWFVPRPYAADDARLLAIGAGDRAAFDALYVETFGLVYNNVVRVLGDAPRSGEVTREVFATVWRDAARFDPGRCDAMTWVLSAAYRHAVQRASDERDRLDGSLPDRPVDAIPVDAIIDVADAGTRPAGRPARREAVPQAG